MQVAIKNVSIFSDPVLGNILCDIYEAHRIIIPMITNEHISKFNFIENKFRFQNRGK